MIQPPGPSGFDRASQLLGNTRVPDGKDIVIVTKTLRDEGYGGLTECKHIIDNVLTRRERDYLLELLKTVQQADPYSHLVEILETVIRKAYK